MGEGELEDVSEDGWDESVRTEERKEGEEDVVQVAEVVGGEKWLLRALQNVAAEELGEIDFRVISEEFWGRVLHGEEVVRKLRDEMMAALLEVEEYEVMESREATLLGIANERAAYLWRPRKGLEKWQVVCEEHRATMEMVDGEDCVELLAALNEQQNVEVEIAAERDLDLAGEEVSMEL